MQLTAQMLHEAFLEAQREVYGIAETQQRSWDNLTNKERLAYDWMIEGLNEKLATQEVVIVKLDGTKISHAILPHLEQAE